MFKFLSSVSVAALMTSVSAFGAKYNCTLSIEANGEGESMNGTVNTSDINSVIKAGDESTVFACGALSGEDEKPVGAIGCIVQKHDAKRSLRFKDFKSKDRRDTGTAALSYASDKSPEMGLMFVKLIDDSEVSCTRQ